LTSFPRKKFPLLTFQNSHTVLGYFVAAQAPLNIVTYIFKEEEFKYLPNSLEAKKY
jgi:hypothetical protein